MFLIPQTDLIKNITFSGSDDYPRQNLKVRGHVRLRSKVIFNFGHRIKALTVSANEGFVRAALQQVNFISFVARDRKANFSKNPTFTRITIISQFDEWWTTDSHVKPIT